MHPKIQLFFVLVILIAPHVLEASPSCSRWVAKVASLQGQVDIQHPGNSEWGSVHEDDTFCPGDKIRTSKWSRSTLVLSNQSVVTLDQNTTLIFPEIEETNEYSGRWFLNLIEGASFFRSRETQRLNIQTPFINAVHEGTEFLILVSKHHAEISVFDGQVSAQNRSGKLTISKGFKGVAEANRAPHLQSLMVKPNDAVQWALYYPPIIDENFNDSTTIDIQLKEVLIDYRQGNIFQALAKLEKVSSNQKNLRFLTLKASLLLSVGRVDEVQPLILQIQQVEPNNSDILALQAIIAIAINQQSAALELANQAVSANPQSAAAKIAQSYSYQALLNINMALTAAREATQLAPKNALAWARLAELQLSDGNHDEGLTSAQKAQALNPNMAKTQIILGFANLAQTEIEPAMRAFKQAILLDSSDPLARLGLGLAKIRKGDIEAGKSELETAVNLDPNNAVIRSYLGKAYYELRNKEYAGTEFNIAKEMDPKDPTPWFYDAILKQTINRPVEALHDMQKAIELNDNRGVYRSSLLLDKDLAARSAGLGRIYNDLGFQRLGLVEGWKSVNTEPTNYSAHRLLADNYASQPRHEIARVSELLQSQLLQPINITPIQPQLAQSNVLIVDGLGPSSLSFNEYNPLFARNRFALQTSGIYGSNNTWGEDVVHSGLWNKGSYSLGQFHYETTGFRDNNFLDQDIYNAFVQGDVSNAVNLQAEYRHEERKNGDLSINFDNSFAQSTENRTVDSYRLGGRYTFSPASSLISSLIYQEAGFQTLDPGVALTQVNRKGFIAELQHLFSNSLVNSITGFGHINQNLHTTFNFLDSPDDPIDPVKNQQDLTRTVFYNYSTFKITDKLRTTLGLSYDSFELERDIKNNPINPKLGLVWNLFAKTTVRAALFRSMNMTRASNQTIEQTQVAGFNQLFDDINGTVAWRYGIAIDHVFSKNLSTGIEYSERKLDVPSLEYASFDWSEQFSRAYVYVTPNDIASLGLEYFYERFDRKANPLNTGIVDVKTHWIPLTLNIFHASGASMMLKSTYVNQYGFFEKFGEIYPGNSNFFVFDVNLNYRLPSRYGMVSLGVKNLFNNHFQYQSTNQINSNEMLFAPEMTLFTQVKLAF
ncbi:MAG: TonB-dependent receptor [Methylococcaceae bacterium]|nr:TonB-dependent receptor [Methylococcaceae bacterium]